MLELIVGQSTDPGRLRASNDDAMGVFLPGSEQQGRTHGWMFVLADGVSSASFGDVAAKQLVTALVQGFALADPGAPLVLLLGQLIDDANAAVHEETLRPERRGKRMSTTVVACALRGDEAVVAHVGDSRCYHLRQGKVLAVTQDHTFVNDQQRLGLITAAEAANSEFRNVLTRSIGPERRVVADIAIWPIKADDILVLCTDGIHGGTYTEDICRIVQDSVDPQRAAEELVRYAVEVDGSDNASVQVIRIVGVE